MPNILNILFRTGTKKKTNIHVVKKTDDTDEY